ncbi:hypothetical protein OG698_11160 [Streptomyces sp. NBC_01003]|uniref:hypothetical protein n=1 Tax=Streptomyces sp. NBC_01003 TaxID=2903714 RepID=UPI00386A9E91|nr:hypothetical protein OG698_11160 [Streptomyces sp. NBC_01003]
MYAKISHNGLHFFAHAPGAPHCALAEETVHHHLLKLELATAARAAGAHAELEARGPAGTWRADVLAKFVEGAWQAGPHVPVAEFLGWIFTGQVIAHRRQAPVTAALREWQTVWTAPRYAKNEAAHLAEAQRQLSEQRAAEQQRSAERMRAAQERDRQRFGAERSDDHHAAIQALTQRQAALEKPSLNRVQRLDAAHNGPDKNPANVVPEIGHGAKISHGPIPSAPVMWTSLPAPLPPGASVTCTKSTSPYP